MAPWTEPKYRGDSVRRVSLTKGEKEGDVCIQHFGPKRFRVCAFLPGRKGKDNAPEPDHSAWCRSHTIADEVFDGYLRNASSQGWV